MAGPARGPGRPDLGADGFGQDAGSVSRLPGSARPGGSCRRARGSARGCVRLSAQGAQQRRSEEPRSASGRDHRARVRARPDARADPDGRAHGRHDRVGARADRASSAARTRHDPGVAVHPSDGGAKPPSVVDRTCGHRGRDPCRRGRQTWLPSGPVAGEAGPSGADRRRRGAAADRSVRDRQAAGRRRRVPSRYAGGHHGPAGDPCRGRGPPPASGSCSRGAPRRIGSRCVERDVGGAVRSHRRARAGSPDDPDLREHPAPGRAGRASSGGAGWVRMRCSRTTVRSPASCALQPSSS